MPTLQFAIAFVARVNLLDAQERPVGGICIAILIAHPTATGTSVAENDGLRLQFVDGFPRPREVIISATVNFASLLRTAVPAVAAIGTVEPHLENLAILRQQLIQLCIEILHVEWRAVEGLMAIPRRQVQAQLQAIFAAGSSQFAHHVAFTVLVRRVAHRIIRVLCGPKTESIVMLCGKDDAAHARLFAHASPLFTVETRWVERLQRCIAEAPLAVAERIRAKMDERIGLQLLPSHLMVGGKRRYWSRCLLCLHRHCGKNKADKTEGQIPFVSHIGLVIICDNVFNDSAKLQK